MNKPKRPRLREKPGQPRIRRARCKQVLAILHNRLERVDLLREEEHEPLGDFPEEPIQLAVVRFRELELCVSLDTVVFLEKSAPPRVQQELVKRGQRILRTMLTHLPRRKIHALLCTSNEAEFLLELCRLAVAEGWPTK